MKNKVVFFLVSLFFFIQLFGNKIIYLEPGACGDIFDIKESCDEITVPFFNLKQALMKLGYELRVVRNLNNLNDAEKILIFNVPSRMYDLRFYSKENLVLFLFEPPTVIPKNYNKKNHQYFSKVYTWADDFIDNKKYFKFYNPRTPFFVDESDFTFEQKKLCAMIYSNKSSPHPLSLYGERKKVIRFFEKQFYEDFDLYGRGWSLKDSKNYKGCVHSKIETLKGYRFCFAYENMRDMRGYVTEKIFDPMNAGCVPVYWGANNITDYVPEGCFIDRRDFNSDEQLYWFLKNMTEDKHQVYVDNIKSFLKTTQSRLFSSEVFTDIVLSVIDEDYDKSVVFTDDQIALLEKIKNF